MHGASHQATMTTLSCLPADVLLGSLHRGIISPRGAAQFGAPITSGCGLTPRTHLAFSCGCWQLQHFSSLGSPSQARGFFGILDQAQCCAANSEQWQVSRSMWHPGASISTLASMALFSGSLARYSTPQMLLAVDVPDQNPVQMSHPRCDI
jgi:hypothetical protein